MSKAPVVANLSVPLVVSAPILKLPRLRVRSRLPVGLNTPPAWLKSLVTVTLPVPPRDPDDRLTTGAVREPVMLSAAPLTVRVVPAFMVSGPTTPSEPPVSVRWSSETKLARL